MEPIAIVGVGCVMPDAPNIESFWNNLLAGHCSIRDVDPSRWDPSQYYNADKSVPDMSYTKIGAFVTDNAFNGLEYRMPPKVVEQVDACQQWALAATRQALQDAGLETGLRGDEGKSFDRNRTAVIIGNAMGGETNKIATKRLFWPDAKKAIQDDEQFQQLPPQIQADILARAETRYKANTVPITEDTMPGHLSNVVAGRIANVFDFGGKNYTTDAACASSLAALDAAAAALSNNECDTVIWGGTDRSMDITPYIQFSKIGALSPDGSRPFDKDANGFVMGEGCAMFVLKRAIDAERDGDKVYAVIRGIGSSSDGKGKGITAPNPLGQVKAVQRAIKSAGIEPSTVGYLEAHGTSTPVGDPVELQSVQEAFGANLQPSSILVGSVKSNIGHLKAAAGAAGMLKVALAMHHEMIPASLNVRELNPRIDWASSPFKVATQATPFTGTPRRAALSSFGFGGTNFHVILESFMPGTYAEAEPQTIPAQAAPRNMSPEGPVAIVMDGDNIQTNLYENAREITRAGLTANRRVGFVLDKGEDATANLELAQKAAAVPAAARLAFQRGVFINQGEPQGKVAFLFPGQGTQYVNMCRDLASRYEVVRNTFYEADDVLFDALGGIKLTDIIWPDPDTAEAQVAANEKLKLTEFTQPAVLAADVAILRLLQQWNVKPDVVAGHSLGEYGALVAAGVMTFADALHAVAARGREMAQVEVPDLGKMASVSADWQTVQTALKEVNEYVIPANKNCPSQTVIAGSTAGIDQAMQVLQAKGLQAMELPVSAAFHSDIVAPASKPLRKVLGRLGVESPKVRILSNVGAEPYPDDPEAILDNLAVQVASPVEWVEIIERMYAEGVRTFIEVGPKKALTGFVLDILKGKDIVAICSNHPKKGGLRHIQELFAFLGTWGFKPEMARLQDPSVYTPASRGASDLSTLEARIAKLEANLQPPASHASQPDPNTPTPNPVTAAPATPGPAIVSQPSNTDAARFGLCTDDVGVSGISIGLPGKDKPLFDPEDWDRILRGDNLIGMVSETERRKMTEKNIVRLIKGDQGAQFQAVDDIAQVIRLAGRSGAYDVADWGVDADFAATLDKTFQYAISAGIEALRDAGIPLQRTYLKTSTGGYLPKEWKLPESLRDETGIIFASAFPGYDNLMDEVSRFFADKYGGRGIDAVHAMANELRQVVSPENHPVIDRLQQDAQAHVQKGMPNRGEAYQFSRKFLFEVLSMGHAQLAQFIGARGPNTQMNAACASTTQAIAMAEDWIRTGRARRVLVVGADDVTSDNLLEWIGSGFLASGAATTKADVTQAALPFDKRRHGMIVGMGAVGLVVEAEPETAARGMKPIARILATKIANSAYHGSRLDVEHISNCMQELLATANQRYGIDASIAANTIFMSHETYTPARGGSASAEIHALRATFGDHANKVVIANTKGFTGHPQGAGIEDAIVLKCLQRKTVPPIANFQQPDPELGDLNLSKGGSYDVQYAVRLAAGFGSQVAMTLTQCLASETERMPDENRYHAWLDGVTGQTGAELEIVKRTLRVVDVGAPEREPVQAATVAESILAPEPQSITAEAGPQASDVLSKLIGMVAEQTGYPTEMLDPELDMEADLGIDTVKQAELFGAIREAYGLPLEEGMQIKDYPTLQAVAGYVQARIGTTNSAPATREPAPQESTVAAPATMPAAPTAPTAPAPASDSADTLAELTAMVAEQTGYPIEMLEPDLDMEADLGIDTVKQAELFAAMRERYNVPLEEGMQIKDYPTLRAVAGYFSNDGPLAEGTHGANQEPTPAATPEPALPVTPEPALPVTPEPAPAGTREPTRESTPEPTPAPALTNAATDALDFVTNLVATSTGYPMDMLEPDLDMEADLGIDTVKQAEIFGQVREHYGIEPVDGLQLSDYPTLRAVAGFVDAQASGGTAEAPTPSPVDDPLDTLPEAPPEAPPATPASVPRGLAAFHEPEDSALPVEVNQDSQSTTAATQGGQSTTDAPREALSNNLIVRREPTLRLDDTHQDNELERGDVVTVGDVDDELLDALAAAGFTPTKRSDKPVGLLIFPGHGALGDAFDAAKKYREHFSKGRFTCVVTRQDGAHGILRPHNPDLAALAGFGKSLKKEFSALCKVIDLHEDADVRAVLHELLHGGKRTEVCFGADGTRAVIDVEEILLEDGTPNVENMTFVVSGGAQGITVEMLAALAPQGPNFLLLGRTEVPDEASQWANWDDARWKQEQATVMQAMKDAGEKVTPVAIQKKLDPMQKAAEVRSNMERLEKLGAHVRYAPVDVRDSDAVRDAVDWMRESFGPIHGVIHAAGMEISKDLSSKDRPQFEMVYGIKHDGWHALMDATRDDPIQYLVSFGSVAGRFGNLGQVDYAAANEYLAKAVKVEAARRDCIGVTLAWGPWGEVGMATRGSIMQIMAASGVTAIPTSEGVRHFCNELALPGQRECVIAGALGAIDEDGQIIGAEPEMPVAVESPHPLLSDIKIQDGQLTATVIVDQTRDPYLPDHAIDGVPVFPGVFGVESFAQAGALLAPGKHFVMAKNIQFASPLKQLKSQPVHATLTATVMEENSSEERTWIACTLTTQFHGPDGKPYGEPRLHFRGRMMFGDAPDPMALSVPGSSNDVRDIYPPFFHGPRFQVLAAAGPVRTEGAIARYAMPLPQFNDDVSYLTHPMIHEALFQTCGLRTLLKEDAMSLPFSLQRLDVLDEPQGNVTLSAQYKGREDGHRVFDAYAVDERGHLILQLTGFSMIETGPAPNGTSNAGEGTAEPSSRTDAQAARALETSPDPHNDTREVSSEPTAQLPATPVVETVSFDDKLEAAVDLPDVDGVVFAAVPVAEHSPAYFTETEQQQLKQFTVPKRALEWQAGRLAAKLAAQKASGDLSLQDVEVVAEEGGKPTIVVNGTKLDIGLSITHRGSLAVACVADGAIGMDLELFEERADSWFEEAFGSEERAMLAKSRNRTVDATCMWAAKEAVYKFLGTGLRQSLHAWIVRPDGQGGAQVTGPDGNFLVHFFEVNGAVLALCRGA